MAAVRKITTCGQDQKNLSIPPPPIQTQVLLQSFPNLWNKTDWRKISEELEKPWEMHECTSMLWGTGGKILPKSNKLGANNPCRNTKRGLSSILVYRVYPLQTGSGGFHKYTGKISSMRNDHIKDKAKSIHFSPISNFI